MRRYNDKKGKPIIRKLSEKAVTAASGKKRKFEIRRFSIHSNITSFYIKIPEEEDEDSFKQQNKTLKQEGKKQAKYRNRALAGELMAQTFSMRRNKIEEKEVPLSELLAEFPLLKDPHEVQGCYKKITTYIQYYFSFTLGDS